MLARAQIVLLLLAAAAFPEAHALSPTPTSAPSQGDQDSRYPKSWWAPAAKEGAPAWEILPQEAGPGEVILSKRNELGLLSNFAATPFEFRGKRYASVEGFWQMMKYPEGPDDPRAKIPDAEWKYTREPHVDASSPG